MDGAEWSIIIPFALIPIYGLALGTLLWSRKLSLSVAEKTAAVWRYELAISTWVLALPGLVAAAWGLMVGVGWVLLPLGIAVGVIATRVAGGKVSHMYALPLIFVGIVDLLVVGSVFSERGFDPVEILGIAGIVVYFGLATGNAIRILRRGLSASRARRESARATKTREAVAAPGTFEPPADLFVALAARAR